MNPLWLAVSALLVAAPPSPPPEGSSRRARSVHPMQAYFTRDDYPPAAALRRAEGEVRVSRTIDTQGVPSGCTVEGTSNHSDLDRATCHIMRRCGGSAFEDRSPPLSRIVRSPACHNGRGA